MCLCVFCSSSCRIFLMQHAVVREASPVPLVIFLTGHYYETRTNDVAVTTEAAPAFVLPHSHLSTSPSTVTVETESH